MKQRVVLILIALAIAASAPAVATTIVNDPWSPTNTHDELNLYEIANLIYGLPLASQYHHSSDLAFAQISPDEIFTGKAAVMVEAKYAGYGHVFGWYQPTGGATTVTRNELFTLTPGTNGFLDGSPSAVFDPVGTYGFYDQAGPNAPYNSQRWYSESARNKAGEDHMVLYDAYLLSNKDERWANHYLMGWEDLPFYYNYFIKCDGDDNQRKWSDRDYQDLVLDLTFIAPPDEHDSPVPEPTSVVLLGIGLGGMLARRLRKP